MGLFILVGIVVGVLAIIAFVRSQNIERMASEIHHLQQTTYQLRRRLSALEEEKTAPPKEPVDSSATATPPPVPSASVNPPEVMIQKPSPLITPPELAPTIEIPKETPSAKTPKVVDKTPQTVVPDTTFSTPSSDLHPSGVHAIFNWLTGGNSFAKMGLGLLLLGAAFALKYFADQGWLNVPIELKLSLVGALGALLTGIGWHLREKRPEYAQLLQGGGIAIIYLTLFSGYRIFHLYGGGFAFLLLVLTTIGAVTIALLQDSFHLAFMAITGGFLAPILASTGSGNHIALFTYYLVLNIGIAVISYFKQWNALTVTGFYFTFIIGSIWGVTEYKPHQFSTTEPFLLSFWLLYLIIGIIFALRQKPSLNGFVDGTLLLGTPIAAFGLQVFMVRQFEYGIAFSALGASLAYLCAGLFIRSFKQAPLSTMKEALFGISLLFATLAIPFAFSGEVTTASWAIEAAGLLWLSKRQNRILGVIFALLLQLAAGIAFYTTQISPEGIFLLNSAALSCFLIAIAALFSSYTYRENEEISLMLLLWGLSWFYGNFIAQISELIHPNDHMVVAVYCAITTALLWVILGLLTKWPRFTALFLSLPIVFVGATAYAVGSYGSVQNAPDGYVIPLAIALWYVILTVFKTVQPIPKMHKALHTLSALYLTLIGTGEFMELLYRFFRNNPQWEQAMWPLIPLGAFYLIESLPLKKSYKKQQMHVTGTAIVLMTSLWAITTLFSHKPSTILPYIPLINPLQIMQIAVFITVARWTKSIDWDFRKRMLIGMQIYFFVWITTIILKSVSSFLAIPYDFTSLYHSATAQTALSIAWTLIASTYIYLGNKKMRRSIWMAGSTILVTTIAKLFFVDLAASQPLVRIISFLFVGGVVVLIGYLSPMPPAKEELDA